MSFKLMGNPKGSTVREFMVELEGLFLVAVAIYVLSHFILKFR